MKRLLLVFLSIPIIPHAAAFAADDFDQIVCMKKEAYSSKLEKKFKKSDDAISRLGLHEDFVFPGHYCFFLNGERGLEAGKRDLMEPAFIAELKAGGKIYKIPHETPNWVCHNSAGKYDALSKIDQSSFRVIDQSSIRSMSVRDNFVCIKIAALESMRSELSKAFFDAALKGEIIGSAKLQAEGAPRWAKAKYDSYQALPKMPKPGLTDKAIVSQMKAAAADWIQNSDIGAKAKFKTCVVTSSGWEAWTEAGSTAHAGRSVKAACAYEVDPNVCIILYDGCRQDHQGLGKYTGCYYQGFDDKTPNRINCAAAKD